VYKEDIAASFKDEEPSATLKIKSDVLPKASALEFVILIEAAELPIIFDVSDAETCSLLYGEVVPIPTLPADVMVNFGVPFV
jgi:hypothetical protein